MREIIVVASIPRIFDMCLTIGKFISILYLASILKISDMLRLNERQVHKHLIFLNFT